MRVAVVFCDPQNSKSFGDIVHALAQGIESQGHDVTVINAVTDTGKTLTPYHYIAVGTVAASPFAKTANDTISTFLRNAGQVSGKRCYAFLGKQGLRKGRVLSSLMKKMESEGMYLKRSDVLSRAEEAKAVGARLHLDKSVN